MSTAEAASLHAAFGLAAILVIPSLLLAGDAS